MTRNDPSAHGTHRGAGSDAARDPGARAYGHLREHQDMAAFPPSGRSRGARVGSIVRARLLDLLDQDPAPVTVLQAPSGFGKTTLVRQWAAGRPDAGETLVWVALNAEAESEHSFWTTVIASARRLGHLSAERAEAASNDVGAYDDPVPVLQDLVAGAGAVTIVLDAYEHARSATARVDEDILRIADAVPTARFVVTTRAATSLTEPARQLRGRVLVLTEEDLEFTFDETRRFLGEHAAEAVQERASEIHRDTRGYPLAIRAASLALGARPRLAALSPAEWSTVVAQDLSAQLPGTGTAEFVRDTCVAPYFDLELAQAMTGAEDPAAVIDELEWNGFGRWVPYLPERSVFQYVDALRDAVRADLAATDPDRHRRGAGVAAGWLHEQGEHVLALELAVDAGRYELASRIFRSVLLSSPESYTTDHLDLQLSRIPPAVLAQHPTLGFARGLALLTNPATRGAAGEHFQRTADQNSADWARLDRPSSFFQRVAKSASLRYVDRYVEAGPAAAAALEFYDDTDIGDDGRLVELRAIGLRQIGYSFYLVGDLDRAHAAVARAIATATMPWSRNFTVVYGVGLSAMDGRSHEAAHFAQLVDPQAWPRNHAFTYVGGLGRVGNAALKLDRFDFAGALAEYEGCDTFLLTAEYWPLLTWTMLQARLGLGDAGPEAERVAEALQSNPPPPGTGDNFITASLRGLLAVAWLAQGRTREATALLRTPNRWPGQLAPAQVLHRLVAGDPAGAFHLVPRLEGQPGHSVRSRASLATLGAAAALRAGHAEAASGLLDRAAAIFREHGARAHLLHVPGADLEDLRGLAERTGSTVAASYLDVDVVGTIDAGVETPPLTAQEVAVLRASLDHPRRSQVAAALHLSPETVKSHMRSIYRKWGVSSREAALERGIHLGLLGDEPGRGPRGPRR